MRETSLAAWRRIVLAATRLVVLGAENKGLRAHSCFGRRTLLEPPPPPEHTLPLLLEQLPVHPPLLLLPHCSYSPTASHPVHPQQLLPRLDVFHSSSAPVTSELLLLPVGVQGKL
jgi:hypothetical protein